MRRREQVRGAREPAASRSRGGARPAFSAQRCSAVPRTYTRATFPSTPRSIPILTMSQTLIPLFTNVAREEGVVADYVTRSGAEGPSHISRYSSLRGKQKPKKSLREENKSQKAAGAGAPVKSLEKPGTPYQSTTGQDKIPVPPSRGGGGASVWRTSPLTCGRDSRRSADHLHKKTEAHGRWRRPCPQGA